jgi:hypothetical protein
MIRLQLFDRLKSWSRSRTSKGFVCIHLSTLSPGGRRCCGDTALLLAQSEAGICGVATPADGHVGRTPRAASCLSERTSVLPASGAEGDSLLARSLGGDSTRWLPHWPPHTSQSVVSESASASPRVSVFSPRETRARKIICCQCVGRRMLRPD